MNVDETRALMKGLQDQGLQIRTPWAKFSARQAKIESTIATFKRCFKSSQLPGTVPLTIVTFSRTAKMCAALLNTRPIVLLPPTLADPEELMTLSPSAIRGPADAEWFSLGQSRDNRGQHALQAQALNRFKKYWQIWYVNRLRTAGKLPDAASPLQLGDIVLITDLKSTSIRSNPHPAVGRIRGFMDDDRAQAIISYNGGSVDRPIESLVILVRKHEQINEKGLCFDPLVKADQELQQVMELKDAN